MRRGRREMGVKSRGERAGRRGVEKKRGGGREEGEWEGRGVSGR